MWGIDVEFAQPRGANVVPFILYIRNLQTGKIVIHTTVNYDMDLEAVERAFEDHAKRSTPNAGTARAAHGTQKRSYFASFYQSSRTTGMTLGAIGDMILEAGYRPDTHCVLSWYSKADINVLGRALAGDGALISAKDDSAFTPTEIFQPVNLAIM